ncbi:hypothetical protein Glove_661g52 [Diversispora epigaea]|uniref:Uncharacterized protein n=1 Tax=Diversispora epigaea TaxID=1348612 RepID=A0A397G3T7_9GLOM|nr:hypothetical protein Glove_661g52 [Diversispora epigaea]
MDYRNNNKFADYHKRYMVARKMTIWNLKADPKLITLTSKKKAIRRYELWMQNAIRRVKRIREIGKKIRAVKVIQEKWLEYFYRPDSLCASELALHYQLLWAVREEMRQINNA